MKKLATTVSAALLVAVLAVGLAATGAAEEEEESDVDVTVSSDTAVDVRPTSLDYSGEPGDFNSTDADGFTAIELENIGSESIEQIHAEADMPSSNPFGTGEDDAYNAGNFIKVSTETGSDIEDGVTDSDEDRAFHFLNRLEFAEEDVPSYIQTLDEEDFDEEVSADTSGVDVGRFRAGEEEFFYSIYYEGDGSNACSGDDAEMWVGTDEHTPTDLGTFDFTDSEAEDVEVYDIVNVDGQDELGAAGSTVEVGDEEYTVYTYCDDNDEDPGHTIRTRFNVEVTSPVIDSTIDENDDEIGPSRYVLNTQNEPLEPGASFPLDIGVEVPLGVAEGDMEQGTVTVLASDSGGEDDNGG